MKKLIYTLFFALPTSYTFASSITNFSFDVKTDTNKYGAINIVRESADIGQENLLINNKNTNINKNQNDDFYIMSLQTKIILPNSVVYIIWGGTGGTMDSDSNLQCKFVTMLPQNKYKISELTYCKPFDKPNWLNIESGNLIQVEHPNIATYAESTDIGMLTYNYVTNKIITVTALKSNAYYKNKFANWTSKQIYEEALNDDAVDKQTGLINTCHICYMYGEKFCFKFKSLKTPPHDKYYNLLSKSCLY